MQCMGTFGPGIKQAMNPSPEWQQAAAASALAVPAVLGAAAAFSSRRAPFRASVAAATIAAGFALLQAVCTGLSGADSSSALGVRLGLLTSVMLLLVCGLGLAIVRYSRVYLDGNPASAGYSRWLLGTLAAVTTLVAANNLAVIALAWTASSIALHQLLTLNGRPAALIAAHKKFLASRLADVCLVLALGLVYSAVGSLNLDALHAWVGSSSGLTTPLAAAALLIAVAVCIKSAQLPLHGWLLQVMEAPTPISALLHAGVVNIGGFLMIRLAPLMAEAPGAQLMLVAIGTVTMVLAALILITRVSVKVALAWSTCAQMGFMLVQCGLGLWHLALLHLVAHSLYKAHAFLSSGSTVFAWRVTSLAPGAVRVAPGRLAATAALGLSVGGTGLLIPWFIGGHVGVTEVGFASLLGLALVPMLLQGTAGGAGARLLGVLVSLGVTCLYFGWHTLADGLFAHPAAGASSLGWGLAAAGMGLLVVVQAAIQLQPQGRLAGVLHRWLFAGLFLDERFTRLTFRLWAPRLRAGRGLEPDGELLHASLNTKSHDLQEA